MGEVEVQRKKSTFDVDGAVKIVRCGMLAKADGTVGRDGAGYHGGQRREEKECINVQKRTPTDQKLDFVLRKTADNFATVVSRRIGQPRWMRAV